MEFCRAGEQIKHHNSNNKIKSLKDHHSNLTEWKKEKKVETLLIIRNSQQVFSGLVAINQISAVLHVVI